MTEDDRNAEPVEEEALTEDQPPPPAGQQWATPPDTPSRPNAPANPSRAGHSSPGLFWGPLGIIIAAIRANHPSAAADPALVTEVMSYAWTWTTETASVVRRAPSI